MLKYIIYIVSLYVARAVLGVGVCVYMCFMCVVENSTQSHNNIVQSLLVREIFLILQTHSNHFVYISTEADFLSGCWHKLQVKSFRYCGSHCGCLCGCVCVCLNSKASWFVIIAFSIKSLEAENDF